jgi:hypothetical protein
MGISNISARKINTLTNNSLVVGQTITAPKYNPSTNWIQNIYNQG